MSNVHEQMVDTVGSDCSVFVRDHVSNDSVTSYHIVLNVDIDRNFETLDEKNIG
jgi:hypothetical protein